MLKEIRARLYTGYDHKAIGEIENIAAKSCQASKEARKRFIETLYYLQFTSRFRENKLYKKASFKDYIYDQFHLRENSYRNEMTAFFQHPKEAVKLGPGVVTKIRQKCGVLKVKKVLAEIEKEAKQTPAKINKIIYSHAKPVKLRPVKQKVAGLENEMNIAKDAALKSSKLNHGFLEQISKLKGTVKKLKADVKSRDIRIEGLEISVTEHAEYKRKYDELLKAVGPIYNYMDKKTVVNEAHV